MKRKSLFLLTLATCLLGGCNTNQPTSSLDGKTSESSSSVSISENDEEECLSGSFRYDVVENEYIATEYNSVMIVGNDLTKGYISSSIKIDDNLYENGFIINLSSKSYFVGFDFNNNLLIYEKGSENNIISRTNLTLNNEYKKLALAKYDNVIEVFVEDKLITSFSIVDSNISNICLSAGGKNTIFKDVELKNDYSYDTDILSYNRVGGLFKDENNKITSSKTNSILVNKFKNFEEGIFETNISLKNSSSDNGIIFGLEDNDLNIFWENGVSYYFFFINYSGGCFLGEVNNGNWTSLKNTTIDNYDKNGTYNLKVVKKGNTVYCLLDNKLMFSYTSDSFLSGTKCGIRAGGENITYSDIRIKGLDDNNISIGKGSFEKYDNVIVSKTNESIMIDDDLQLVNGTINAQLIPGAYSDNGIIFRATTPNGTFYEGENGLSYYWLYFTVGSGSTGGYISFSKFENGKETKLQSKFLPWGSWSDKCYDVKIVLNQDDIYCYFDGRLSFYYHEDNSLKGNGVGLKTTTEDCTLVINETNSNCEKETNEYLIFGHSYTEYWYTYKEDFPNYKDINDIGIGASNTGHWDSQYAEEVIAYEPRYGIYWNGINDINGGFDVNTIANNVESLLVKIHNKLLNFEVALVGVCRCPASSSQRDRIASTNELYRGIANKYNFVHYVETEYLFCDENGNELSSYFTGDGLHPNDAAYKKVAKVIENVLGK